MYEWLFSFFSFLCGCAMELISGTSIQRRAKGQAICVRYYGFVILGFFEVLTFYFYWSEYRSLVYTKTVDSVEGAR